MISKIDFSLTLSLPEYRLLASEKPWTGKWKSHKLKGVIASIRSQLENSQKHCAYCGLAFRGQYDKQIDHIAAQSQDRHPQFTFTLHNLVLACLHCNNLNVKGDQETIDGVPHHSYRKCNFLIVHPYFDDPNDFYQWTDGVEQVLIQVRNNHPKAINSIQMFSLDSPEMSEWRAVVLLSKRTKNEKPISPADEILVEEVMNFIKPM